MDGLVNIKNYYGKRFNRIGYRTYETLVRLRELIKDVFSDILSVRKELIKDISFQGLDLNPDNFSTSFKVSFNIYPTSSFYEKISHYCYEIIYYHYEDKYNNWGIVLTHYRGIKNENCNQ
ncbi:MAG: hypothetical protein ACP6IQ_01880 [Candidatus Njordarchaeia archaeon]